MPASTSSKTSVGTRSRRARIVFSASITRDSSPPDATRDSGRGSWPTFSATRNSTSSAPCGPISPAGRNDDADVAVGHAEIRQHLVDGAGEPIGAGGAQRRQRRGALDERGARLTLARLELPNVQSRRVDEIELGARLGSRSNHVGERAAVLLREPKEEVAPAPHIVEPRRDRARPTPSYSASSPRQRLDCVVRGVVRLLEARQRWIDALDARQVARDGAELLQDARPRPRPARRRFRWRGRAALRRSPIGAPSSSSRTSSPSVSVGVGDLVRRRAADSRRGAPRRRGAW